MVFALQLFNGHLLSRVLLVCQQFVDNHVHVEGAGTRDSLSPWTSCRDGNVSCWGGHVVINVAIEKLRNARKKLIRLPINFFIKRVENGRRDKRELELAEDGLGEAASASRVRCHEHCW